MQPFARRAELTVKDSDGATYTVEIKTNKTAIQLFEAAPKVLSIWIAPADDIDNGMHIDRDQIDWDAVTRQSTTTTQSNRHA